MRCGNRRADRCPSCSRLYAADTFHLIRAGVAGGKGVPEPVADNPLVFATLTAPSFGAVHGPPAPPLPAPMRPSGTVPARAAQGLLPGARTGRPGARPASVRGLLRLRVARALAVVGARAVAPLHHRPQAPPGAAARGRPGPPGRRREPAVRQGRRVPGPRRRALPRPDPPRRPTRRRWFRPSPDRGHRRRPRRGRRAGRRRGHPRRRPGHPGRHDPGSRSARRSTPASCGPLGAPTTPMPRSAPSRSPATWPSTRPSPRPTPRPGQPPPAAAARHRPALAAQADAARRPHEPPYRLLGRWAHTLGFRGHFSTKSRRYSVTLGRLRRARQRAQIRIAAAARAGTTVDLRDLEAELLADDTDEATLVIGSWAYAGSGWANAGETALATAAAARAREYARRRACARRDNPQHRIVRHWQGVRAMTTNEMDQLDRRELER